jgi:hypothetical protein
MGSFMLVMSRISMNKKAVLTMIRDGFFCKNISVVVL